MLRIEKIGLAFEVEEFLATNEIEIRDITGAGPEITGNFIILDAEEASTLADILREWGFGSLNA